ncbi:type II secretion system ATPase GspE [Saccharospirillum salsuginis]|uniref:Type II secretion system protein E n=1 Tax=Saccharospirillum salsuginis TaxID=418750 RepID=A0A918N9T0_9GAMM|nr:type II secretion system ATPase GspE [Saccharospirillum salsuginis]GGX51980.1 type II secretion system protein E [Saccharospirillum salsuginis]
MTAVPPGVMERRLPFAFAKRHGVVIDYGHADGPRLLYRPDVNLNALQEAQRIVQRVLPQVQVNEQEFSEHLNRAYQTDSDDTMQMVEGLGDSMDLSSLAESVPETEDLMEQEDDAPIIRLINAILTEAVRENASDIHVETYEKRLSIRFRVDGVLREVVQPKRALAPLLVSRIKVMARLDIAEKRVPQDGRIALRVAGREVDLRVSTIPSNHGERVVLRLLDKQAGRLDISHLGLDDRDYDTIKDLIQRPHGIILVTGPTGSGKTTTLYAALQALNSHSRNIMTVEDPIEYSLPGIGQTQVNTKVDMTFARGLRAILRQDPDVVMIGEIRDYETGDIAVQASLTGHLVLSTLHTNSATGAVTRLQDMGIEPFLLASSLIGLVSQRLVRTLCPDCKSPYQADKAECEFLGIDPSQPPTIYHAKGCSSCKATGYRGRLGLYEFIKVDEAMRQLIHDRAGDIDLERHARTLSPSILDDGKNKVLNGLTTVEEVLRVYRSY